MMASGFKGADVVGVGIGVQHDADLQLCKLAFVPAHQVGDLAAPWLQTGKAELAADLRCCLHQRDAMAAFGGGAGGLQPGRTGTDDDDVFRRDGGGEAVAAPFPFAACRWVDEAGNPVVARPAAPAHLVAGNAAAHVFGAPFGRLAGEVRVGDLAAHDGDEIGLTAGDDGLAVFGCADMRLGRDLGVVQGLFQHFGQRRRQLFAHREGRDDAFEVEIAAGADGDIVDLAGGIVEGCDFGEGFVLERDAVGIRRG